MTSYKVDTEFRLLLNDSDLRLIIRAWKGIDPDITDQEAIRRTVQKFFEDDILPVVRQKVAEKLGSSISVFDNARTHVQLD